VQVRQDRAVVDDDDAGSDPALDRPVGLLVVAVVAFGHQSEHAHHRGEHRLISARGGRGERLLLDRLAHGGVDLLERQCRLVRRQARVHQHRSDQQQHDCQRPKASFMAQRGSLPATAARGGRRRRGEGRCRLRTGGGAADGNLRRRLLLRDPSGTTVKRHFLHRRHPNRQTREE
jgi:hypothetical protein